jgi:hypothetical protein
VPVEPVYIEQIFSTWLYTGNGSTQTITNGIDLSTKGGLVWAKPRDVVANNTLYDTARGVSKALISNTTASEQNYSGNGVTSFNTNGFAVTDSGPYAINDTGSTYVTWTFRKQPKFFDVVTYTGSGSVRTVAHNLGSTPACMIIKQTSASGEHWGVYHRSLGATKRMYLSLTSAEATNVSFWNDTEPTSTEFTVGTEATVNGDTKSYVAYLFAHNAGGFGLTGTDNVISCGSFTADGDGNATVNLGYEPQWVMMKATNTTGSWFMNDNMRGMPATSNASQLFANLTQAENTNLAGARTNSTGFNGVGLGPNTYIYIAIRRGPMKVPTSGTSVFLPYAQAGTGSFAVGFPTDLSIMAKRAGQALNSTVGDRLRGKTPFLSTSSTAAEDVGIDWLFDKQNSFQSTWTADTVNWNFRRAPSFFDVVCYTGDGSATRAISHNLTVTPELMIAIVRNDASLRSVYHKLLSSGNGLNLNSNAATTGNEAGFGTPSSSIFTVTTSGSNLNYSSYNYVAYLFATCAGVSKVGSYTGTATTLQIDCGFTGGARFVLIKRTDSTGSWYVWDSSRGIVSGNDPYLLLNSTAAEVTNTDYIDAYSAGFEISSTAPAEINASGGTYIFLSIA